MILFITEQQLKELSPISLNLDPKYITEHLKFSHENILELLGYNLYNKIESDIQNNILSGNYQTLLQTYIYPCLINSTLVEALPHIHIKLNNQGVNKGNTDYLTTASIDEVEYIRNNFEKRLEVYNNKLKNHLTNNTSLYPELVQPVTSAEFKTPDLNNNLFSFPLYLGKAWDGKDVDDNNSINCNNE